MPAWSLLEMRQSRQADARKVFDQEGIGRFGAQRVLDRQAVRGRRPQGYGEQAVRQRGRGGQLVLQLLERFAFLVVSTIFRHMYGVMDPWH